MDGSGRVDQLETTFEGLLPPCQADGSGEALRHLQGNIHHDVGADHGHRGHPPRVLRDGGRPGGGRRRGAA